VLGSAQCKELSLLMLGDVISAVAEADFGGECCIVSSSLEALQLGRRHGMRVMQEQGDSGVNVAVKKGMRMIREKKAVVVPADIPLLASSELKEAISLGHAVAEIVISPSRAFDGTNLLLFSKEAPIRLSYDADSFWRHLGDAAKRKYKVAVYTGSGIVFDVDTVEDLKQLASADSRVESAIFAREALELRASS
jgi:2-phospho-L-lactate guanylyltransferase